MKIMKIRTISALVLFGIAIPSFLIGGDIFKLFIIVVALLGMKELIDIRETKKVFPTFVKIVTYILLMLVIVSNSDQSFFVFGLEYWIVSLIILSLMIPIAIFYGENRYNITDSMFLIGSILFLGMGFNLMLYVRDLDLNYFILLFLIVVMTDTFAYFTGMLIGKNRFEKSASPKKSLEGFIGGSVIGTFVGTVFYTTVIGVQTNILVVIIIIFTLSLVGQFGDLVFSSIKRYYNKKDFSNLIPGHGGMLDRSDSIVFVFLTFILFLRFL